MTDKTNKRFRVVDCDWNHANGYADIIGHTFATPRGYAAVIVEHVDKLRERFTFHLDNGGYSVPPGRAQCALDAARAEIRAKDLGIEFVWTDDADADTSWMDADTLASWRAGNLSCEHAAAVLDGDVLASCGGIFGADAVYRRVMESELADEAIHNLTHEED